ncbi:hypothetical protein C7974DRAFT_397987 [Boeremia exigua]|uniref:uncharacterized protein n=1 Tax=Boeremia exigua TaxID=749465 RepID=UPI001E8DED13|nr:uncharacterized protein C7974DRAFT_397987 [Boeremia exigua]KAH6622267.1 hypothetical protein C7974DRAFT_397987 [Boeremia exigua]
MSEYLTQWKNPGDVFSVLLIVGGDVILLALACLTGRALTPVAFSFGWVAYAISAVVAAIGDNKLLVRCPPELSLKVINLKNGYCRDNKSWLLGRFIKDYNYWMPGEVRNRLLDPRVRSDEENQPTNPLCPLPRPDPASSNKIFGRSDAALCIAVYKWADNRRPGEPDRDWLWWSGLVVSILQLAIASIPWGLHNNSDIFIATAGGTVLAYASASLPQWKSEKWPTRSSNKTFAITEGNGSQHVIVILGADHGLDLEALAGSRAPDLKTTRVYTCALAVLWLVLLITCCGINTHTWYLLAVGGLGMAQNLFVAGAPRQPAALGLPIELVSSGDGHAVVPEVFAEQKVMWTIMEFEEKHRSCGDALVKEFFPGKLRQWEIEWWESDDAEKRSNLLKTARREAWNKAREQSSGD